jgi:hypothetical protein
LGKYIPQTPSSHIPLDKSPNNNKQAIGGNGMVRTELPINQHMLDETTNSWCEDGFDSWCTTSLLKVTKVASRFWGLFTYSY